MMNSQLVAEYGLSIFRSPRQTHALDVMTDPERLFPVRVSASAIPAPARLSLARKMKTSIEAPAVPEKVPLMFEFVTDNNVAVVTAWKVSRMAASANVLAPVATRPATPVMLMTLSATEMLLTPDCGCIN